MVEHSPKIFASEEKASTTITTTTCFTPRDIQHGRSLKYLHNPRGLDLFFMVLYGGPTTVAAVSCSDKRRQVQLGR